MGKFSDDLYKRLANKGKTPSKEIEFACGNCLNIFTFTYSDIWLKQSGDIQFDPEPECPQCGATEEIVFSDYGQEKIEDMLMSGQIRKGA